MATDREAGSSTLAPDDAFAVLGNGTRMQILETLGEADAPLSFSELHDRIDIRDSGQFNYHLDKLVDHFVTETDAGYVLQPAGRRVIEAVVAGAVTEAPVMEPTPIDEPCPMCGGPTVVAYHHDRVEHYCAECEGAYANVRADSDFAAADRPDDAASLGYLGATRLPPAGFEGRDANDLHQAAANWLVLDLLAAASGICPRCAAPLDETVRVCENHVREDGFCSDCNNRHAVQVSTTCGNCPFDQGVAASLALLAEPPVLAFLLHHGINPVSPSSPAAYTTTLLDYEEDVRSVEPFEARLTFSGGEGSLALTVDEDLEVVDASRQFDGA